jgi:hypothetical protein
LIITMSGRTCTLDTYFDIRSTNSSSDHTPSVTLAAIANDEQMSHFISEDDLKTFEGWLKYQGYDPEILASDDLAKWRQLFDEISKRPDSKVGLMKLGSSVPGDRIYGVAVRDSGLWLSLWVRRSWKSEFFVFMPRSDGSNVHASYHRDGTFHHKSDGRTFVTKTFQRLDQPFKGTEHLSGWGGHGPKSVGAICDPDVFAGLVELPPGILGPRDGDVVIDLVEPDCDPISWPGEIVREEIFKDAVPWIVIRVFKKPLPISSATTSRTMSVARGLLRLWLVASASAPPPPACCVRWSARTAGRAR